MSTGPTCANCGEPLVMGQVPIPFAFAATREGWVHARPAFPANATVCRSTTAELAPEPEDEIP